MNLEDTKKNLFDSSAVIPSHLDQFYCENERRRCDDEDDDRNSCYERSGIILQLRPDCCRDGLGVWRYEKQRHQEFVKRQYKGEKQKQLSKEFVREWLIANGFMGKTGQQVPQMSD